MNARLGVCVGVFWSINGKIFGERELRARTDAVADMVDSSLEHWSLWEDPNRLIDVPVRRDDHEYFAFSRGRVLFDLKTDKPVVFCDPKLLVPTTRKEIARFFGFSDRDAKWQSDPHYQTDQV